MEIILALLCNWRARHHRGGIASAVAAQDPSYLASWAVAYLVLVVGVAQIALGAGMTVLARGTSVQHSLRSIFVLFNLGNAGVIAGTLLRDRMSHSVLLVDLGSLLLAGALLLGVGIARGAPPSRLRSLYYLLVIGLLLSMVIGILLAHR
jgi:hypothetical protein